jgi:hypothetical protein
MRYILVIAIFFAGLGAFPVGKNQPVPKESLSFNSSVQTQILDEFQFDFSDLIPEEARIRSTNSHNSRIKNDRIISVLEEPGLVFLVCRLSKSYSEIHIDKYIKFLFQLTIQVNAP